MKKLFALLAIAAIMVACNDSAEKSETKDSSNVSTTVTSADSAAQNVNDSLNRTADSLNRPDSVR